MGVDEPLSSMNILIFNFKNSCEEIRHEHC